MEDMHPHLGEIVRSLERIEKQVMKTNGRVSALEKWKWVISGGLVVLGAMSAPNIGVIAKAFAGL